VHESSKIEESKVHLKYIKKLHDENNVSQTNKAYNYKIKHNSLQRSQTAAITHRS